MLVSVCVFCTLALPLALGDLSKGRCPGQRNKVLLVSFDGFRHDYMWMTETPNLRRLKKEGPFTYRMTPPFPTTGNPSHFTLLTGRHVENHGVVANRWFNVSTKETKSYHQTQFVNEYWDNGSLPIWITAQRQGLKAGSYHFPGTAATYQGERVQFAQVEPENFDYTNETEWRHAVDVVVGDWLHKQDVDLVTLYFGDPDVTGHKYGPQSPEVKEAIQKVDRTVGYLMEKVKSHDLAKRLNIIITSDHGMSVVSNKSLEQPFVLADIQDLDPSDLEFTVLDTTAMGMVLPKEGALERVFTALERAQHHVQIYRKDKMPLQLHYANNFRILPIILVAEQFYAMNKGQTAGGQVNKGEHGHLNSVHDMGVLFMASGPDLLHDFVLDIKSTDIYPLMCHLLGITTEMHDGSLSTFRKVLAPCETGGDGVAWKVLISLAVVGVVCALVFIALRKWLNSRKGRR